MDPTLSEGLGRLPELLESTRGFAARTLAGLQTHPVAAPPHATPSPPLPHEGRGVDAALSEFAERWAPGFSGSAGPRYLGFVTGGATPASIAGDWLTAAFDQNVVSSVDSSASDLERETVRWLREMLDLGPTHAGSFVTGATMSNFVGLAIAGMARPRTRDISSTGSRTPTRSASTCTSG